MLAAPAVLVSLLAGAPAPSNSSAAPCLWDRDTLAVEAEGEEALIDVLVGRFDRFPPQYYEVRLERTRDEVERVPDDLSLYDDAGVACDRLGRADEAIEWMARKRRVLDGLSEPDAFHEYTYLANLGTFHVHRWLRSGRDRDDMADVERARELVAAAIELNPDAHFGRERYQLLAIDCLIEPLRVEQGIREPSLLTRALGDRVGPFSGDELEAAGYDDAVEGVSGLIRLGAAWESAFIWMALEHALTARRDAHLARLAARRVVHLVETYPDRPPFPGFEADELTDKFRATIYEKPLAKLDAWYDEAREAADAWRASRNEYLLARLEEGVHPDDDPEFWAGWGDRHPLPKMPKKKRGLFGR